MLTALLIRNIPYECWFPLADTLTKYLCVVYRSLWLPGEEEEKRAPDENLTRVPTFRWNESDEQTEGSTTQSHGPVHEKR